MDNRKKIKLIVAVGKENQIGLKGDMPWRLSGDLKNFKKITNGGILIMGRKTFDSIGKALPGRLNFVITSKPENIKAFEVCSFPSIEKALKKAREINKEIFIIGGASIYSQMIDMADEMIITKVEYEGEADTYFPEINLDNWVETERINYPKNNQNNYPFDIITYYKKSRDE